MPCELICASCRQALWIPEGVGDRTLTCPRCLAEIDNPAAAAGSTGTSRTPGSAGFADSDVRWDARAIAVGLVIMGILVGLGVVFSFTAGPSSVRGGSGIVTMIVIGIAFLIAVLAAVAEVVKPANKVAQGIDRLLIPSRGGPPATRGPTGAAQE